MIHLLFTVLSAEMMTILLLLFKTPLREPLVAYLDGFNQGKARLVLKSVGATVFVAIMYNIYTVVEIRSSSVDPVDSPNRVIFAYRMLEAYLMGVSLFLLLIIDKLQHHMKEIIQLTNTIISARKQDQACEDIKKKNTNLATSIKEVLSRLNSEMRKMESECDEKEKDVQTRKANSLDLKTKLEGLHLEYDHLLTENKDLKDQLRDMKQKLSHSSSKKIGFFSWDLWGL